MKKQGDSQIGCLSTVFTTISHPTYSKYSLAQLTDISDCGIYTSFDAPPHMYTFMFYYNDTGLDQFKIVLKGDRQWNDESVVVSPTSIRALAIQCKP
ncbi:hypothetical protein NPIL_164501 [Nephila pilipes]|uniref:Uncharacterized protein n=1 Tax=Nephila pilipes TaxID=299642 RepID=A0A8X6Q4E6_NEPPI|nr:hypothetical protein NPIL_164501 [Nephila pilipes]